MSFAPGYVYTASDDARHLPGPGAPLPARAGRLLLPDARLARRRRGSGAGDPALRLARHRWLRGPLVGALVAVPDRDQRLPRRDPQPAAARDAGGARRAGGSAHAARGSRWRAAVARAGSRDAVGGRAGEPRGELLEPRERAARVRRGAAAPARHAARRP